MHTHGDVTEWFMGMPDIFKSLTSFKPSKCLLGQGKILKGFHSFRVDLSIPRFQLFNALLGLNFLWHFLLELDLLPLLAPLHSHFRHGVTKQQNSLGPRSLKFWRW